MPGYSGYIDRYIEKFRKFTGSVFVRLIAVFLVSGMAIILAVTGFLVISFRNSEKNALQKNMTLYLIYAAKDLGNPPSPEKALEISRQTDMLVFFEGLNLMWSASGSSGLKVMDSKRETGFPDRDGMKTWHNDPLVMGKISHGIVTASLDVPEGVLFFQIHSKHRLPWGWERMSLFLAAVMAGGIFLAYLAIRLTLSPLRDLDHGVRLIGDGNLEHDIECRGSTEFRQLAETVNTMTGQIRRMLHSREQLLLDVSHELRSPLTRMKVTLEFIDEGKERDGLKADILEMETIVSEILEAARFRNARSEPCIEEIKIYDLIQETVAINVSSDMSSPGVVMENIPDNAIIKGDRILMKMAFGNIIGNAVKYSGGSEEPVKIGLENDSVAPGFTVIRITDKGCGIPDEDIPFVFEPFYRVDKSRSRKTGGYGLGLTLCRTVMEAHNGRIKLESAPGRGTSVFLYFPEHGQTIKK